MRSRLARWFVRTAIVLAAVAAALATAGWAVLSLPQFGARMSGARLERAKANPQYREGRFTNLQPEAPTRLAALGDYIVRQFSGSEVREPPAPLPVMAVDKAALAAAPAPSGLRAFWIGHASTYGMSGSPTITLPAGFTAAPTPLAIQLVGKHLGEATLVRAGRTFQRETDWHRRHPLLRP